MFKGPWLVVLRGGLYYITTQFHRNIIGMIISHDKDRYEPVRIQWNVIRVSNGAQTKGPHLFMLT